MATTDEVNTALLDAIKTYAGREKISAQALLHLAEAVAWIRSPHQSHAGGSAPKPPS